MIKISTQEAFLIFGKWHEHDSELHIAFFESGNRVASPGWIFESSPAAQTISVLTVTDGLHTRRTISLMDATFRYEEPSPAHDSPRFGDAMWSAYLFMELRDGSSALFAERAKA